MGKVIDFFKKWVFFKIDPKEKQFYRERVMKNDHRTYRTLLVVIMILQFFMFFSTFIGNRETSTHVIGYRILYVFLFLVCFIAFFAIEPFYKKNKCLGYFIIVSLTMLSIMIWGAGISILDSDNHRDLTYFVLSLIAAGAFITLEPWVFIASSFLIGIEFSIVYVVFYNLGTDFPLYVGGYPSFGFFVTVVTAVSLVIIGSTFNFSRRIRAIKLELQVTDLNKELNNIAYIDALTGVYSRRYLTENIDVPLNFGEKTSGVIMFDLDHFKVINDTFGHQIGDKCLELVGLELKKLPISKHDYVVRYGGEEFLVYFDNIGKEKLETIADDFRQRISSIKVTIPGGNKISFTISAGLAIADEDISYNDLINKSDAALYRAKAKRNKVSY